MKRLFILIIMLTTALCSCDKNNSIEQPVELRFSNTTGMLIDSIFFNINEENQRYKFTNIGIDETTDYVDFDYSYSPPLATIYIDSLIVNHPRTDLVCCLIEGKYTVEFNLVLDSNNEQKTATCATKDD